MKRHARDVIALWTAAGVVVHEWSPPSGFWRLAHALPQRGRGLLKWAAYLDKYVAGGFSLRLKVAGIGRRIDNSSELNLHVIDHSDAMYLMAVAGLKCLSTSIVTIHDLTALKAAVGEAPTIQQSPLGRLLAQAAAWCMRKFDVAIAVSNSTAADVKRLLGRDPYVVPNVVSSAFLSPPLRQGHRHKVVIVASDQPYKDRPAALLMGIAVSRALGLVPSIVVVGPPLSIAEKARLGVEAAGVNIAVHTGLADHDLAKIYDEAVFYVSMSHEEGFGWPIIEAAARGVPALLRPIAPHREVAGRGAVFVAATAELTEAVDRMGYMRGVQSLGRLARENADRFTFDRIFERWLTVVGSASQVSPGSKRLR